VTSYISQWFLLPGQGYLYAVSAPPAITSVFHASHEIAPSPHSSYHLFFIPPSFYSLPALARVSPFAGDVASESCLATFVAAAAVLSMPPLALVVVVHEFLLVQIADEYTEKILVVPEVVVCWTCSVSTAPERAFHPVPK